MVSACLRKSPLRAISHVVFPCMCNSLPTTFGTFLSGKVEICGDRVSAPFAAAGAWPRAPFSHPQDVISTLRIFFRGAGGGGSPKRASARRRAQLRSRRTHRRYRERNRTDTMSKRGRGGGAGGNRYRVTLGLPVGALINCADNTGAKNIYIIAVKVRNKLADCCCCCPRAGGCARGRLSEDH